MLALAAGDDVEEAGEAGSVVVSETGLAAVAVLPWLCAPWIMSNRVCSIWVLRVTLPLPVRLLLPAAEAADDAEAAPLASSSELSSTGT